MGSCYYVKLKVKLKDEERAIKALQDKISRGEKEHINYGFNRCLKNKNYDLNIFDDLIRVFLAEHQNDFTIVKTKKGFTKYISGFNASYGWESVMLEMFEEISPYLENKSKLYIDCDDGIDVLVIKDGKCIQEI
jgi:hypothetical protein